MTTARQRLARSGDRMPQVPPSQRAWRTLSPLALPKGMLLTSPEGRRWRDTATLWYARLTQEQRNDPDVLHSLCDLIWLRLKIEEWRDQNKPVDHLFLHMMQELRLGLRRLGIVEDAPGSEPEGAQDADAEDEEAMLT